MSFRDQQEGTSTFRIATRWDDRIETGPSRAILRVNHEARELVWKAARILTMFVLARIIVTLIGSLMPKNVRTTSIQMQRIWCVKTRANNLTSWSDWMRERSPLITTTSTREEKLYLKSRRVEEIKIFKMALKLQHHVFHVITDFQNKMVSLRSCVKLKWRQNSCMTSRISGSILRK